MPLCQNCQQNFEVEPADQTIYDTLKVPAPTLCPDCRQERRLRFKNDQNLYQRTCDLCKQQIISVYRPDNQITVYCPDCFFSDRFDGRIYSRPFDFNKTFFAQWADFKKTIPHLSTFNQTNDNCSYLNFSNHNKNCQFLTASNYNQTSFYGRNLNQSKNCIDCLNVQQSNDCYEIVNCQNCQKTIFSENCNSCQDCLFISNCHDCQDCMYSTNLSREQYYIFNTPHSPEDYFVKKAKILNHLRQGKLPLLLIKFQEIISQMIHPATYQHQSNTAVGNYLENTSDCYYCFNLSDSKNCRYSYDAQSTKNSIDVSHSSYVQEIYESHDIHDQSSNIQFGNLVKETLNSQYIDTVFKSNNLFACVSLISQKNCILNKPYEQNEYKNLRQKIIEHLKKTGEYGQFFPDTLSPFTFQESSASRYFDAKNDAIDWTVAEENQQKKISTPANNCHACQKTYRLTGQELNFYRAMNLPLPANCPRCRDNRRHKTLEPRQLWESVCSNCKNNMQTTIAPEKNLKVYCHDCYQKLET